MMRAASCDRRRLPNITQAETSMQAFLKVCVGFGLFATTACWSAPAQASFIVDFETVPNGVPTDGMTIDTQYAATQMMTFSLLGGGSPILAEIGAPRTAFQGIDGQPDIPADGQGVGSYFLTANGEVTFGAPKTLVVDYATPFGNVGGYILDIDGYEAWRIDAFDSSNNLLDSISLTTASPNAGDGLATGWSFFRPANDIAQIQLVYTGGLQWEIGFAWDNFSASHAPLPSSLALLLTGGLGLLVPAWRRRRGA